jgi:hypothetical protein
MAEGILMMKTFVVLVFAMGLSAGCGGGQSGAVSAAISTCRSFEYSLCDKAFSCNTLALTSRFASASECKRAADNTVSGLSRVTHPEDCITMCTNFQQTLAQRHL